MNRDVPAASRSDEEEEEEEEEEVGQYASVAHDSGLCVAVLL